MSASPWLGDDALIRSLLAPLRRPGHFQRRYNLKGERFEGGQGYVVRFRDEEVGRDVAVKRPLHWPPPASMSPEQAVKLLARFLNEARMTGQLQHPSIVPIYEVGVDDHDTPYYVMKWVDGESLERKMTARDRIERDALIGTLLRVAEALSYAHENGVIHRDLKPSNVMVGEHGVVYVMDWGLAKRVGGLGKVEVTEEEEAAYTALIEGHAGTLAGRRAGTPGYMSPEQARGDLGAVGPRSDVYGVGAMIYHALMGHAPYMDEEASSIRDMSVGGARGLDTEQLSALQKRLQERIEKGQPKAITRRGVPEELVAICERAMAYRQEDRYATMAELASDLKAYLERRVVSAYETGTWAETKKWVQRNKALAVSLAGGILVLVAGVVFSTLKTREAEARTRDVLSLSAQKDLDDLVAEAETLWPAQPGMVKRYEDWLRRANDLIEGVAESPGHRRRAGLAEHKAQLLEIRRGAKPLGVADEQQMYEFADPEQAWWERSLSKLVVGLEELRDPKAGLMKDVLAEPFGWGVAKRYAFAKTIKDQSMDGSEANRRWTDAIDAIRASPKYDGLELEKQMGLVPIGINPDTQLWEFLHLASEGNSPGRRETTQAPRAEDGIVFVLVPGVRCLVGAQKDNDKGGNYDRYSSIDDQPPHYVSLSPFFLSKYEVTQAQWYRLTGGTPSDFHPPGEGSLECTDLHPVENVSWKGAVTWLQRFGLDLPTEAQWECACRAGTTTTWSCGNIPDQLREYANLADQSVGGRNWKCEPWDDGGVLHVEIGAYRPNQWGFFDMYGNVQEWCRDGVQELDALPLTAGIAYAEPDGFQGPDIEVDCKRILRGGSYDASAIEYTRSSARSGASGEAKLQNAGLRPCMKVNWKRK